MPLGKRLINGNWPNTAHHIKSRRSCQAVCGSLCQDQLRIGRLINSDWCTELISFEHNQAVAQAQCTKLELGVKSRHSLMWVYIQQYFLCIYRPLYLSQRLYLRTPLSILTHGQMWLLNAKQLLLLLLHKLLAQSI